MEEEPRCFVPGCSNQMTKFAFFTFHRVPVCSEPREELLEVLHLPATTHMDHQSVMCSAHFSPMMGHTDLVFELLDAMITTKPPPAASSMVPKCAAVGCCVNLYSRIPLFKFPPEGRRFDLWRMIAGCPKKSDCLLLCARHFKRNSFHDSDMTSLKHGANPVYPPRPLNPMYNNYCPLKPTALQPDPSTSEVDNRGPKSRIKMENQKKWRCGAVGCDVTSESHPYMRKISFPADPDRLSLWREIVGYVPFTKYNNYLCTRHFGLNQFYDGELRRNFVKMSNPIYPTGPLNLNTMDYCPPELDITLNMEQWNSLDGVNLFTNGSDTEELNTLEDGLIEPLGEDDDSRTEVIIVTEDNRRCSADGCPVTSITHPNVKLYKFPKKNCVKFDSWMKIATPPTNGRLSLCARHFDSNQRDRIPKYPFGNLDPETQTYKPVFDPLDPRCCVPNCEASHDDGAVTFHRFPLRTQAFKTWIERIGWKKLELYDQGDVFRGFRVCSKHFIDDCFKFNANHELMLSGDAVPTMFLGGDVTDANEMQEDPSSGIEVEFREVNNDSDYEDIVDEEIDSEIFKSGKRRWTEVFFVVDNQKRLRTEPTAEDQNLIDPSDLGTCSSSDSDEDIPVNELPRSENGSTKNCERQPGIGELDDFFKLEPVSATNEDSYVDDVIETAARVCGLSSQIAKLKSAQGKHKEALIALGDSLKDNLNETVNAMGLGFVRDCLTFRNTLLPDVAEEVTGCKDYFAARLALLSAQCLSAYSKVIELPSLGQVLKWMTRDDGSPGFSSQACALLVAKSLQLSNPLIVSLNILEVPLKKQVDWDGHNLIGYVDLGCGTANGHVEASTAIVFVVNAVNHSFRLPLGHCLVDAFSPHLRANLIRQYLILLSALSVSCFSVVCENSSTTHETYRELGVKMDELRTGHFDHPANQENVFCFVDIDSSLRSMKNLLAATGCFLSKNSLVVRWEDVEFIDNFVKSDVNVKLEPEMTSAVRALHAKLRKDQSPFRNDSATLLALLHKRHRRPKVKSEGTIEFLMKMESILKLFNSDNLFCTESPAVQSGNIKITLRRIRQCGIYLDMLRDPSGVKLCCGVRRDLFAGVVLNLVSLVGYLKKVFLFDKRKKVKLIMGKSLTLGAVRQMFEGTKYVATPLEFKEFLLGHRMGILPSDELCHVSGHAAPKTSTSLSFATLNRYSLERYDDFMTYHVLRRWVETAQCPECTALVVEEMSRAGNTATAFDGSVRKLLRTAESTLRLFRVTRDPGFSRFSLAVMSELSFDGFLAHDHLFNSVEFGAFTHFATLVKDLLRIYLRFRLEIVPVLGKVKIYTGTPAGTRSSCPLTPLVYSWL